jgi:hypothetical protein
MHRIFGIKQSNHAVGQGKHRPVLTASLTELALEYFSRAVAIEVQVLGKDPDQDGYGSRHA